MVEYDESFYGTVNDAGASSAEVVVALALQLVPARTAVDVGCGTGIWTSELRRHGVDAVGLDGDYVPRGQLRVEADHFISVDLARTLDLGRTFDLAVCVEVAEHLDPARADGFVSDLCTLAPAIVFSAATPKQGGTHHVNEQWPDYWIARFAEHGFTCWDALRPAIRYDPRVAWIYRQNLMVVLGPHAEPPAGAEQLREPLAGDVAFEYVARYIVEREDSARTALVRAVRRRMGRGGAGR